MLHADHIILQSRPFNKNSVMLKFSDLLYDVLGQFKLEHLDRLIHSVGEDIPDEKIQSELIDGLVSSRCNSLKMLSNLSINEQFFVLAHLNLDLLNTKVEDPNPVFVKLVQSFVREMIMTGD
ncbi:MAG: hypothetical protein K0R14_1520 [Burkholderiales bacterium]|jgi:hypothetical protein|nr:hypothetical protein [Burkholderiales bacterium]